MSLHVKDIQFPHLSEVLTPGLPTHGPPVVTITESDTYPKIPSTGTWTLCFSRSLFPWSLPWASSSLGFVPPLESQLQCPILLPLLLPFLASCLWFCWDFQLLEPCLHFSQLSSSGFTPPFDMNHTSCWFSHSDQQFHVVSRACLPSHDRQLPSGPPAPQCLECQVKEFGLYLADRKDTSKALNRVTWQIYVFDKPRTRLSRESNWCDLSSASQNYCCIHFIKENSISFIFPLIL